MLDDMIKKNMNDWAAGRFDDDVPENAIKKMYRARGRIDNCREIIDNLDRGIFPNLIEDEED